VACCILPISLSGETIVTESYHVRLQMAQHLFSAAHFITYQEDVCEPLHGHNYRVALEVHGPLDQNHCVVDFVELDDLLKTILNQLDHQMLLPTLHPTIRVFERDETGAAAAEIEVTHGGRRWIFPKTDCVLLPVANTTAELLARYIASELKEPIKKLSGSHPTHYQVAVEESEGRWGVCELDL
jgi:6-pyruvoyltetrahydropterin/6-carboxytetrahydropterin synthase